MDRVAFPKGTPTFGFRNPPVGSPAQQGEIAFMRNFQTFSLGESVEGPIFQAQGFWLGFVGRSNGWGGVSGGEPWGQLGKNIQNALGERILWWLLVEDTMIQWSLCRLDLGRLWFLSHQSWWDLTASFHFGRSERWKGIPVIHLLPMHHYCRWFRNPAKQLRLVVYQFIQLFTRLYDHPRWLFRNQQ